MLERPVFFMAGLYLGGNRYRIPVPYTHLDVYKRQTLTPPAPVSIT